MKQIQIQNTKSELIWNISAKSVAITLLAIPIVVLIILITIPLQEQYSNLPDITRIAYLIMFGVAGLIINLTWLACFGDKIKMLWEGI